MSDLPEPDPAAIATLLQGLPRVKITPETITQHTIDQWYEREREYRAENERLRKELSVALDKRALGRAYREVRQFAERETARADRAEAERDQLATIRTLRAMYDQLRVHGMPGQREVFGRVADDLGKVLDHHITAVGQPGDQTKETS